MWCGLWSNCSCEIHASGCRVSLSAPLKGRLVSRDPASAFQQHVSMCHNNGKMNHWLEARTHTHTHSLSPLQTPFGSRHVCKVLKSESGQQGDCSHWPQKWGLHRERNKYKVAKTLKGNLLQLFYSFTSLSFLFFLTFTARWISPLSLYFLLTVSMRQRFKLDRFSCHFISFKYH